LVFDLDTQSWTRWNIPAWGWHVIRKLTGSTGKGRALPVFSDASANLFTLQFGKGDNGASFSWHAEFGDSSFGSGRMKQIPLVRFGFETVSYGGTAATVRLDSTIVNELRTVTVTRDEAALNNAGFLVKRIDAASFHHIRHKLSGTIVDDQDHPKLVEREFELDFVGQI
ncbi:MAG TPA: hypothetical protein P5081_24935, partial [Phycisphaerae bacterium]|nr:hypothetical protein [Phycisphaerae bacterium]